MSSGDFVSEGFSQGRRRRNGIRAMEGTRANGDHLAKDQGKTSPLVRTAQGHGRACSLLSQGAFGGRG